MTPSALTVAPRRSSHLSAANQHDRARNGDRHARPGARGPLELVHGSDGFDGWSPVGLDASGLLVVCGRERHVTALGGFATTLPRVSGSAPASISSNDNWKEHTMNTTTTPTPAARTLSDVLGDGASILAGRGALAVAWNGDMRFTVYRLDELGQLVEELQSHFAGVQGDYLGARQVAAMILGGEQ